MAILALILFVIAGLLQLLGTHFNIEMWLIVIGGILLALCVIPRLSAYAWPGGRRVP